MMLRGIKFVIFFSIIIFQTYVTSAIPLTKRLVDLSHTLSENTPIFPGGPDFKITKLVNGTVENFGIWLQLEEFASSTHTGTHMDAPSHMVPGALNIDEIPLSEFFGPAAVIDITNKADLNPDAQATIDDLLQWESSTGKSLNGTIVLVRSGWTAKYYNRTAYLGGLTKETVHFPGLAGSACQWLVDNRKIKGAGTDAMALENGLSFITNDFPCHHILLGNGLYILESVANIEEIPISGAQLHVFPLKLGKGSGSPARIIASVPEYLYDLPSNDTLK